MYDICLMCKKDEPKGIYTTDGYLLCDSCADSLIEEEDD